MAYYWATWLADALRTDPFVAERMIELDGWKTRGRPPSQFSFLPTGIVDHHTACLMRTGHDPQNCVNGILAGNSSAPGPISQLLGTWTPLGVRWNGSNASPRIIVVAAGRSNHVGVNEYPWGAPPGNGSSIGIEWCGPSNTAVPWPDEVIELRERVDACILRHNDWPVSRVTTHWETARPLGRKIDPSGPWDGETSLAWNAHWNPELWRQRIAARLDTSIMETDLQILEDSERMYDTRPNYTNPATGKPYPGSGLPMAAGETRDIPVWMGGTGAALQVTAIPALGAKGYLTVWKKGRAKPNTSCLNWNSSTSAGAVSNSTLVPTDGGWITVYASEACELILDITGYAP